jgi:ABC-2 type transport system permease protein
MKNIFAIAERDLKAYFTSPIAYVVLTIFIFLAGFFFYQMLGSLVQNASIRAMQAAQTGQPPQPMDMPGDLMRNFLSVMVSVMLFILPLITMPLFSEEKKRGTIELLLTAPVTDIQVVLGKFLAAALFYILMLATTLVELVILFTYSQPALGPIITGYLGVLLYGLAFLAIGMFISTLTENQIIASILTFAVILMLWLIDGLSRSAGPTMSAILQYLSVFGHLNDFLTGVVSTSHIIFYISLTLVGLFLTYRSLDSLRWRG